MPSNQRTIWLCEIDSNEKSLQKFLLTFGGKSFESTRNETKTERTRNGTKLGCRVVAEIQGDVWVAAWRPNFGRNLGRRVVAEILTEKSFPSALT